MKKLLAILFSVSFFLSPMAKAQEGVLSGEVWTFPAFCLDEESAKGLSAAAARNGNEGYREFMKSEGNRCFDKRLTDGILSAKAMLVEKVWTVQHANGEIFDFWTAADESGELGYVWFKVIPEEEEPGQET